MQATLGPEINRLTEEWDLAGLQREQQQDSVIARAVSNSPLVHEASCKVLCSPALIGCCGHCYAPCRSKCNLHRRFLAQLAILNSVLSDRVSDDQRKRHLHTNDRHPRHVYSVSTQQEAGFDLTEAALGEAL